MSGLIRFGVSLEKELSDRFDGHIRKQNYASRSEAIRDLIRDELIKEDWRGGKVVAGALTMIYDHHRRDLVNKLLDIQHDFGGIIVAAQHIHVDHNNCLEIVAVKGSSKKVRAFADLIKGLKGVSHSTLSMTATGRGIS